MNIYIFDIDGVLADLEHRLHFKEDGDYDKFYSEEEMLKDGRNRGGIWLARHAFNDSESVFYSTGRPEKTRMTTLKWLHRAEAPMFTLYMRLNGDFRPSWQVKIGHIESILKDEIYNPELNEVYFVDDDPKNVENVEKYFANKGIRINGLVYGTKRL